MGVWLCVVCVYAWGKDISAPCSAPTTNRTTVLQHWLLLMGKMLMKDDENVVLFIRWEHSSYWSVIDEMLLQGFLKKHLNTEGVTGSICVELFSAFKRNWIWFACEKQRINDQTIFLFKCSNFISQVDIKKTILFCFNWMLNLKHF